MKGMRYSVYMKRKALRMWLDDKVDILKVCHCFKCASRTLYRWKNLYDGTLTSLENKSSRPLTPHPNAHTQQERETILHLIKTKPNISYNEMYGILRAKYAYGRSFGGFYNYILRNNLRPKRELERYIPKPYDTPEMLGTKWQMDVKFVPKECYHGVNCYNENMRFYQYTMIDEATRERFLFPYQNIGANITVDFVKRAIAYFGYAPDTIQTDNGPEFTNLKNPRNPKLYHKHGLDIFLEGIQIKHQLIRPYTPRLNGKVERSHRSDQENFYNYLKFKSYDELKKKMMDWNIRYNNRPHASLTNREGKKVWWTPIQKREDLLKILKEAKQENHIRFLKNPKTIKQIYQVA